MKASQSSKEGWMERVKRANKRLCSPCAPEDAVVALKHTKDGNIIVTLAPGWRRGLPKTMEDDPACLIAWNDNNILATVNAFNVAIGNGAVPPGWLMGEGNPITIPGLKRVILSRVQEAAVAGKIVGNCLIAPNDFQQYVDVVMNLKDVGYNPFFIAHAVCPIGRNFVLADRRHHTTAVAAPIIPPAPDVGVPYVPVFA